MGILGGILGEVLKPITGIIDKAVVDKDKKRELEFELQKIIDQADARYHNEVMAQIEVNKEEAKHASVFVAGWRPFIGWVGGLGLAYNFLMAPFIEFLAHYNGYTGHMPTPNSTELMTLVLSMLGVGAMRSYDKIKGTASLPAAAPANPSNKL